MPHQSLSSEPTGLTWDSTEWLNTLSKAKGFINGWAPGNFMCSKNDFALFAADYAWFSLDTMGEIVSGW